MIYSMGVLDSRSRGFCFLDPPRALGIGSQLTHRSRRSSLVVRSPLGFASRFTIQDLRDWNCCVFESFWSLELRASVPQGMHNCLEPYTMYGCNLHQVCGAVEPGTLLRVT